MRCSLMMTCARVFNAANDRIADKHVVAIVAAVALGQKSHLSNHTIINADRALNHSYSLISRFPTHASILSCFTLQQRQGSHLC